MTPLTREQRLRRWSRLPALALAVFAALPLGLLAAAGWVEWAQATWARLAAATLGLRVRVVGRPPPAAALLASNHVGYLDILALGSALPGRFLAKVEIARWPLLGWIARRGGSVFIDRESARDSRALLASVVGALVRGRRVVVFPEGVVSQDGRTLGTFRPMMFQACIDAGRPAVPVALAYRYPTDPAAWAWIEEPNLWLHLWRRVLPNHHTAVEVRVGEQLAPRPGEDRKALAARVRAAVSRLSSSRVEGS